MKKVSMKNLRSIREKKKMRVEELAYKSGLSFATITKYELGDREPLLVSAQRIAEVLGVTTEDLGK